MSLSYKGFPTHRKGTGWVQGIGGSEVAPTLMLVVLLSPTNQHFGCFTLLQDIHHSSEFSLQRPASTSVNVFWAKVHR